jgi:DNA-binding CsgD family transcriptional regulator
MSDHLAELTPRERETFELLRLGLTNEEIAERLGISLDGAKYHVSQILSKLGVASRDEAATVAVPPGRTRSWQAWPLALKIAALVVSGALIAGMGLLGFGVLRTSESDDADDASGTGSQISLTLQSDDPLEVATYHNTTTSPRIGQDHWHASYGIYVGDQRQINTPTWESGVHTHGDGIIHIHPFQSFEEGPGAALNKWFEYGGGELTATTMREPGHQATYHNGDPVPGDGRPGQVYVILGASGADDGLDLSGQWTRVPPNYRPQDGDQIRILFEPEKVMRAHVLNPPSAFSVSQTPPPSVFCTDIKAGLQTYQVCTTATASAAATAPPPP